MQRVENPPPVRRRDPSTHKGTYGRVVIVAGSPRMPGAAVLATRAALRGGAGLATAAIPTSLSPVLGSAVPEATQLLLPEPGAPRYRSALLDTLRQHSLGDFDAMAVGPGLDESCPTSSILLEALLGDFTGPEVVDADALNLIAKRPDGLPEPQTGRVWTPHPGEFKRLTGESPTGDSERVEAAKRFVRPGEVVVLKGHRTVVVDTERFYINETGSPALATGGSGDVLTGILAALLGQGYPPFDAACLGVYLHGSAGDLAAAELSETSLIAGDITEYLPRAVRQYEGTP